jgi:hypothetical protein
MKQRNWGWERVRGAFRPARVPPLPEARRISSRIRAICVARRPRSAAQPDSARSRGRWPGTGQAWQTSSPREPARTSRERHVCPRLHAPAPADALHAPGRADALHAPAPADALHAPGRADALHALPLADALHALPLAHALHARRMPASETDRERPALDGRVGGRTRLPSGRFHHRIIAKWPAGFQPRWRSKGEQGRCARGAPACRAAFFRLRRSVRLG